MTIGAFEDRPPESGELTDYDRSHLSAYLRPLDAANEGADWREAVQIIFGLDPADSPLSARAIYDSHLARARWMTRTGYRNLLKPTAS